MTTVSIGSSLRAARMASTAASSAAVVAAPDPLGGGNGRRLGHVHHLEDEDPVEDGLRTCQARLGDRKAPFCVDERIEGFVHPMLE